MDLYRVNLNLLVALDILLQEKNVTAASKKIFLTQSAMSNNLQQLRTIFKDELLMREKNGMALTGYAKELQPQLHRVLLELGCLVTNCRRFDPQTSTRVFKIGLSDYLSALILPKLIERLQNTAPNIKIRVVSAYHFDSTEPFEKEEYDLAIGKIFQLSSPVQTQLLFKDTAVCIINPWHPLAKKKKISLKDYLSYQHIAVCAANSHFPPIIEQSLAQLSVQRNIQVSLPFVVSIFAMIECSKNLIATIMKTTALRFQKKHRYVIHPLPFTIPNIEFYLAWHKRFDNDAGHQWLRQQVIDVGRTVGYI